MAAKRQWLAERVAARQRSLHRGSRTVALGDACDAPATRSVKANMHEMSMLASRNAVFRALAAVSMAIFRV